jgi:hypothetical protein
MFKHFIASINLGERLKRSALPATTNVLLLIKKNFSKNFIKADQNLEPFSFYTDGGTFNLDYTYFI